LGLLILSYSHHNISFIYNLSFVVFIATHKHLVRESSTLQF
jgi:hypothetical protein